MGRPIHWEDGPIVCYLHLQRIAISLKIDVRRMHEFNQSLRYDKRMHAADIAGSIAYAKALTLTGILTKDEENKIVAGLKSVGKEWEDGVVSQLRVTRGVYN